ncbi:MAG: hypothetical protein ABIT38_01065 [Gemmatimonadaceae bacterium]
MFAVVKMPGSKRSSALRRLTIGSDGLHIGEPYTGYRGIINGIPTPNDTR